VFIFRPPYDKFHFRESEWRYFQLIGEQKWQFPPKDLSSENHVAKYNHAPFNRISYATEKLGRIGWFMTLAWLSWLQKQSVLRLWLA
jgi:hypothetical protein